MARRSDHSREELKELALSATEELLNEKPAHELSTRQIAKKMGYTVGTLYQIFNNLPDLLLHVNARTLTHLYQQCHELDLSEHAQTNICNYALTYFKFAHQHQSLWELIFDNQVLVNDELPDWYLSKVVILFTLVEVQLKNIQPQASEKEITKTSRVLWSSVHGICMLSINDNLFSDDVCTSEALIHSLINNFLQGWDKS